MHGDVLQGRMRECLHSQDDGTVHHRQGTAFRGRKFRIFLEKAIIALKHHSRHFLTEDFYIFIFLTFIVKNIYQF